MSSGLIARARSRTACEQKAWLVYFDLTYLHEMWYGYGRTGRTGAYGPEG